MRSPAATARSRSASATASCWSPCPTRRTSTRSTTSARSRTATCSRWWPRRRTSSRRSRSSPGWTARSRRSPRRPPRQLEADDEHDGGGARRGAHRQARPGDHDPGGRGPRLGRPHRADRARRPRALPRGRRAPRRHALAEEHPGRADQPPEGHGGPEHRREARAAGRPHQHARRRQAARPACRDASDRLRREDRHPRPGQEPGPDEARGSGVPRRGLQAVLARRSASRTARSWSPGRPGRGSRPPCTRR